MSQEKIVKLSKEQFEWLSNVFDFNSVQDQQKALDMGIRFSSEDSTAEQRIEVNGEILLISVYDKDIGTVVSKFEVKGIKQATECRPMRRSAFLTRKELENLADPSKGVELREVPGLGYKCK